MEKYQEVNFLRCKRVLEYSFLRGEDMLWSPQRITSLLHCLGAYDWSLANMLILHLLVSRPGREPPRRCHPAPLGARGALWA